MLYIVATPIGNLKEITVRAIEVLKSVDCIYAENPRHSLTLLNEYEIKKSVFEYEKFSEAKKADEIIGKLKSGQNIALITDAGMPLISDPGHVLIQELIKNDLQYTVVSGASAFVNALILSGFDTKSFTFAGFLPNRKKERQELIDNLVSLKSTLIFYLPVHDIDEGLTFLHKNLGGRCAALVKELTKKFESVIKFKLGQEIDIVKKGEFVLVIEGKTAVAQKDYTDIEIKKMLKDFEADGLSKTDAVKEVVKITKKDRKTVYNLSVAKK